MNRLPLWSTVACVGLLVFVAPVALANNNNKPAPHPAAAHPAPAAHPAGRPAGQPNMGAHNPMAGAGGWPSRARVADRLSPFALNMQTLLRLRNSARSRGESNDVVALFAPCEVSGL